MKATLERFFKQFGADKELSVIIVLLSGFIIVLAFLFAYVNIQTGYDKEYINLAGEQRVLSQKMVSTATEASIAKVEAFTLLKDSRDLFEKNIDLLINGNAESGLPPSSTDVNQELDSLTRRWNDFRNNADIILNAEGTIRMISEFVRSINEVMPKVLEKSDEVVNIMVTSNATPQQIYIASRQLMLSQRISYNLNRVLVGGRDALPAADNFSRDTAMFANVLKTMIKGSTRFKVSKVTDPKARALLDEISQLFVTVDELTGRILQQLPQLFAAQNAASTMFLTSETLLANTTDLMNAYTRLSNSRFIGPTAVYIFQAAVLLLVLWLSSKLVHDSKLRLADTEANNRRNQDAILHLLDQIGDLADGDLTVKATVTEDITGAIADAINYSITELRNLVMTINNASLHVSDAAERSRDVVQQLAELSEANAQQILGASATVTEMSDSIEQVSNNAIESAEVAEHSVQIAHKGAESVRDTIKGMNVIRETILETSKLLKRLGENSQEIGDIVELINDIADQTNILALNAAIQASSAGESGKGFTLVADEVQRLAERAGDSTRRIEILVKNIQQSASEAISSMEKSTSGVVQGTKIAQQAGRSLEDIEMVSGKLAELIKSMSDVAREQAQRAHIVAQSMHNIQEVTVKASQESNQAAETVGNLAFLANDLRKSVSGFILPQTSEETVESFN